MKNRHRKRGQYNGCVVGMSGQRCCGSLRRWRFADKACSARGFRGFEECTARLRLGATSYYLMLPFCYDHSVQLAAFGTTDCHPTIPLCQKPLRPPLPLLPRQQSLRLQSVRHSMDNTYRMIKNDQYTRFIMYPPTQAFIFMCLRVS